MHLLDVFVPISNLREAEAASEGADERLVVVVGPEVVVEFGQAANEGSATGLVAAEVEVVVLLGGFGLQEVVNVKVTALWHDAFVL